MALTIIIIAGNEERVIVDCLKSAKFAEELILVAANSNDATKSIAKKEIPKIKIVSIDDHYGRNFAAWRNLGLQNATSDWVFYLDADERITPRLKHEILTSIKQTNKSYFVVPRANYFLGKRVRHGGTYPDYVKRLYQRSKLSGWLGILHEEPQVSGSFGYLKNDLLHYTHRNLSSMLDKTLIWTDMEAKALYEHHHPPVVWWRFIRMMATTFIKRYFIQSMWKDGLVGLISAIFESFDTFIIYARLWELQQHD